MSIARVYTIPRVEADTTFRAIRLLHLKARGGLTRAQAAELLPLYTPENLDRLIALARRRGHLLEVSRHLIDGSVEQVYFQMGGRPDPNKKRLRP